MFNLEHKNLQHQELEGSAFYWPLNWSAKCWPQTPNTGQNLLKKQVAHPHLVTNYLQTSISSWAFLKVACLLAKLEEVHEGTQTSRKSAETEDHLPTTKLAVLRIRASLGNWSCGRGAAGPRHRLPAHPPAIPFWHIWCIFGCTGGTLQLMLRTTLLFS